MRRLPAAVFIVIAFGAWPCAGQNVEQQVRQSQVETQRLFEDVPQFQADAQLRPAPSAGPAEFAPETPGDPDIGPQLILQKREQYQTFSAFADGSIFWTDNAALSRRGELDDVYYVWQVGLSAQPRIKGNLFGEASVRHQWFRYDEVDVLNFNALEAGGGLIYSFRRLGDLSAWARYEYTRLSDEEGDDEFFTNHSITLGAQKPFVLARAHFLYVAWLSELSVAGDPHFARRHEHSLVGGYNLQLTRALETQIFYRLTLLDFFSSDRHDFTHVFGGALSWSLTDWASLNASASISFNRSNRSVFDYDAANLGGGLSLRVKF